MISRLLTLLFLSIVVFVSNANAESPPDRDYFSDSDPQVKTDKGLIAKFHIGNVANSLRQGNYPMAMEDINFALRYFPNHPQGLQLLGVVARLQKKPALPIAYFERALSLFPQYAVTYAQYGAYLVEIGDYKSGIDKLLKAVELDPKLVGAHVLLSKAYVKIGDMQLARKSADVAKELGYVGNLE